MYSIASRDNPYGRSRNVLCRNLLFLGLGDQTADGSAEAHRLEALRHCGIGINRVAVMVGGPTRPPAHARSFTAAAGGYGVASASHACLVLSRYAA